MISPSDKNPHAFLPLEKQEILNTRHEREWDPKVSESPWVFEPTLGSPFYRYKTFLKGKIPTMMSLNCLLRRSRSRHMIFVPNSVPSFNQKNHWKIRCETPKQKPFRVSLMFWTTNWKPFPGKLHIPDHRILLGFLGTDCCTKWSTNLLISRTGTSLTTETFHVTSLWNELSEK